LHKLGNRVVVRKLEIECWGWISCAPLETAEENDVYECWGEVDMVNLELEPLGRKCRGGGAGLGHPAKTKPLELRFCQRIAGNNGYALEGPILDDGESA
jgi:hypothetical protein